jgi:hypothetical protein
LHSPVQQRRILRGRALIHVLNRTQVVLPPNPSVQLSRGNHISGNQWQSVAISGNQWIMSGHHLPPDELVISGNQWQSVDHEWPSPATR